MRYEITTNGDRFGSTLRIGDGPDIGQYVQGFELRHRGGELPVLELEGAAADITAAGDAEVQWLFAGSRFSMADVRTLMESPPDEDALTDIARRLAGAMGQHIADLYPSSTHSTEEEHR